MPGDSQRLTDVSVALDRVGQLIREQGDPNGSRKYFEEALKIDRALHKRSATRRDWQENLVFSLTRIGDLDRQLGRQREALMPYEEALVLQRRLAADPTVIAPQADAGIAPAKDRRHQAPAAGVSRRRSARIAKSWRSAAGCSRANPAA